MAEPGTFENAMPHATRTREGAEDMTSVATTTDSARLVQIILSSDHRADPYPAYAALRDLGPLAPGPLGAYLLPGYQECAAVLGDADWGHGYLDGINPFRPGIPGEEYFGSILRLDPPDHTRLRGLVARAFTARRVERLRAETERVIEAMVDETVGAGRDGEVDLVSALATRVPLAVICDLLGVPTADYPRFDVWARAMTRGLDPGALLTDDEIQRRDESLRAFDGYFQELIATRRANLGTDLISQLIVVEQEGDRLTSRELTHLCILLLIAGYETTVHLIGNGVLALSRHPDQFALLRERPELTPAAIDEILRFDPPVQLSPRVALRDQELAGRTFSRGDGVLLLLAAANRDPAVFADPDRFDITRFAEPGSVPRHLGFGLGLHFCIGSQLARMEAEIVLLTLLRRTSDITVLDETPPYRRNLVIRGLRSLRVRIEAAG
jgi:hypothetical protein